MNANEIIIPCRLSYANIWEPKSIRGSEPKYSVSLIIPKADTATLAALRNRIEQVKADPRSLAKWGGKLPPKLKLPLRDGDEERDDASYEGCMFLNANSARPPRVIDGRLNDVMDRSEVYSGCYAKVKVALFAYAASGNRGIGASLEVIQKVRDGERLGGGGSGLDGFEAEARPADETAEAEKGPRSAFCKPTMAGAAKTGHRNPGLADEGDVDMPWGTGDEGLLG